MPRQRSKKIYESRLKQQRIVSEPAPELEPHGEESASENESVELDKDEEEEELDRIVLGDGDAFKAQLGYNMNMSSGEESGDGDAVGKEDLEADVGLEHVDDADVTTPL